MKSTIYVRFSNLEQSQGSSKERQLQLCRDMNDRHGWVHDLAAEIVDEGKSAFAGANRAEGSRLGEFERRVHAGEFRDGHVLIVENLDRISRQGYGAILPFLKAMADNGVSVATVDGDRVYEAYQEVPFAHIIEVLVKAELARQESQKKSDRLRDANDRKVQRAQAWAADGKHIATTLIVPGWIDVDPATYEMSLNQERVRVLQEIFQLTIDGFGTPAISKLLNRRGEPVWNNRGRRSENGWTVGYLTKLVNNRAVLGEYHPMNRPRHGKATPKGVVVLDRYPQAIDALTFGRALAARRSRKGASGSWQITHRNLLSGIARCAECNGPMRQVVTAKAGQLRKSGKGAKAYPARSTISYLRCSNAANYVTDEQRQVRKCTNRKSFRYEGLEQEVLTYALNFASASKAYDTGSDKLKASNAELHRQIDGREKQIDNLTEILSRNPSPGVERALLKLEAEVRDLKQQSATLEDGITLSLGDQLPVDYEARVEALNADLNSPEHSVRSAARIRMKQLLGKVLGRVDCEANGEVWVEYRYNAMEVRLDNQGRKLETRMRPDKTITQSQYERLMQRIPALTTDRMMALD